MGIRDSLKERAVKLGFDLVGIAPANPGRDLEFALEWLKRGYAGEMDYLANPKRLDPKLVLPSTRSVVCVGLIYDTRLPYSMEVGRGQTAGGGKQESEGGKKESEGRSQEPEGEGSNSAASQSSRSWRAWSAQCGPGEGQVPRAWIARYAWGRDYHKVVRAKLEKLRAAIVDLAPGTETRVFVDSGPVSERAFARYSGLGWMGKNTCIINEGKGSWFFLGVILTSLALEPDLPAPDRCGSCRACLDACPTGALVEPYVMDASRCISYLTIELKGSIPLEFRPAIGSNVFGCDICQDVCPWNAKNRNQESEVRSQEQCFEPMEVSIQQAAASNLQAEAGCRPFAVGSTPIQNPKSKTQNSWDTFSLFAPPLAALAAMTEEEFRRVFRHSPIRRTKYHGWLRNLCVAMGNSGDARFIPKLTELSDHPDPIVREHALWALEQIQATPA